MQTRFKFSFAINNTTKYRLDYFTEYLFIFIYIYIYGSYCSKRCENTVRILDNNFNDLIKKDFNINI